MKNKSEAVDNETGEIVPVLNHKGKPLTAEGYEIPDPVPMAPPVGYKKQPSMIEIVRDMVRSEHLRRYAEGKEQDTFEEADDFDVDDDPDPLTKYEAEFEPIENVKGRKALADEKAAHDKLLAAQELAKKEASLESKVEKTGAD